MGQSQSAFEKAVASALGNDDELYAFPSEPLYETDHVKLYNLDHPTTPLAVVYPKTASEISSIVKLAAANNLKVQGKSGGHSYGNFCDPNGGIIVDLKHFQKFEIDTKTWFCKVGAGTLLGDLTKRMYEPHRRAMAHGTCPQVGIGGHATIGGLGPSSRLWGAALDHIEEVEMVVANGDIIRANEKINSDIFWAVKGAGASFGVSYDFSTDITRSFRTFRASNVI
jgi:FAD/FMN-containing dehydrogenase